MVKKIKKEPLSRPLKKKKKLEVKFLKKGSLNPCDRLEAKIRDLNETKVKILADYIEITKQVPQHLCDRLSRKVKQSNEVVDKILVTKVISQHPCSTFRRKVKELNNKVSLIKKLSQHPIDRLARKVKELNTAAKESLLTKIVPSHPRYRLSRNIK